MSLILGDKNYLLFDGAMGTMLQRYGLQTGRGSETFNMEHPDIVEKIHKEYTGAGCDIITTNTFGANEIRLQGFDFSVEDVVKKAAVIARKAAGDRMVALDIGPTGDFLEPLGSLTYDRAYNIFTRQIAAGTEAGVDLILIETFSDIKEACAAIDAAKKYSNLPVVCTFTFQKEGRTFMGYDVKTVVRELEGMGVDALGANCSVGPQDMVPIIEEIVSLTNLPVIVQPNAGLPQVKDGSIIYNITPAQFASYIGIMAKTGAKIFGGCCGTDPEFIRASKAVLEDILG